MKLATAFIVACLGVAAAHAQTPAALMYDSKIGPIAFGTGDLQTALEANGYAVTVLPSGNPASIAQSVRVILTTDGAALPSQPATAEMTREVYAIRRESPDSATNWWVIGKDAAGAMYGGLELAEAGQLADGLGGVTDRQTNPYLGTRGINLNIPLDARRPSYSDASDSAQANIGNMWETNFWPAMLEEMARDRYNLLLLWNLHPLFSMVRVPEYPNVALADVKRKAGPLWFPEVTGVDRLPASVWGVMTAQDPFALSRPKVSGNEAVTTSFRAKD